MENNFVGWEEWVSLPELNLPALLAKTDTGAETSALHAFNIQAFGKENNQMVKFGINPIDTDDRFSIFCSAKVIDQRNVTSSNGISELRYVIETEITIGDVKKKIPITLTNRENMKYKMIIGRSALDGFQISADKSFLQKILSYHSYKKAKKNTHRRSLRIGILSLEPNNYSNKRIIEAAEINGHFCEILNTKRCYLNIESDSPEIHYDGKVLPHYDAIIPRIGPSITKYGMAVVRQFEAMGTFCLNSSASIGTSRDKLAAHQALAINRIPMPDTAFANSPRDTENIIDLTTGAPLVVKLLESSQGKGVILAETKKAASITNIDIDEAAIKFSNKLNAYSPEYNCGIISDVAEHDLSQYDLIINTSSEHMPDDWFERVPKGATVAIQTNDFHEIPEHINTVNDLTELKEKYIMEEIYYIGVRDCDRYNRFMIIGKK